MSLKKLNHPTEQSQEIKSLDRFQEELTKKLRALRKLMEEEK